LSHVLLPIFYGYVRQDLQDCLDFFFHNFPDENDEEQPAFGGER
jgi:hypothetical protein